MDNYKNLTGQHVPSKAKSLVVTTTGGSNQKIPSSTSLTHKTKSSGINYQNEKSTSRIRTTKRPPPVRLTRTRRSMSWSATPQVTYKMIVSQPVTIQRRLTISGNKLSSKSENQHLILICLASVSFTSMLAMAIIAPFFPAESAKKGMRESINGLVFSVYALTFMIFSPVISIVIPMIGTKLVLIVGIFVAGISNILFGLLDKIDDLNTFTVFCFVVRIFEAIGGTAFTTATYTILMQEFPKNVGTAFSIVETSVGLGLSLGPAMGGFLYNIGGFGFPFFVLGAVMLFNIPLSLFIIRDSKDCKIVKYPLQSYLKLISNFRILVTGGAITVIAQLISFIDPTMEPNLRSIGLNTQYISLIFLIMSATYTFSSPLMGWLSSRFKYKFRLMAVGLFFLSIEFLFLGPAGFLNIDTTFLQTAIVMGLIGISYSIGFIPTFEALLDLSFKQGFPDDVGTYSLISGLWSSFCSFGEILGPVFGGFLTENLSFKQASTIMGFTALIMATICGLTSFYVEESKSSDKIVPKKVSRPSNYREKNLKHATSRKHSSSVVKSARRHLANEKTPLLP